MGESVGTRQLNFQIGGRVGNVTVTPVTTTTTVVTLPLVAMNRYVTLQNDGTANLYFLLGAPGTTPVLTPATTGTMIAPNGEKRFRLQNGVDGVLALVTSTGTSNARLYYSSNQEGYALGNPPGQA